MRSSEKNRFQNAFTVCNLTLDAVVSDMFGNSSTDILNYFCISFMMAGTLYLINSSWLQATTWLLQRGWVPLAL